MNNLTVFYDELCVVCAKEINHYKKQDGSQNIDFQDITSPLFDAKKEGLDPFLVHKVMHARTSSGEVLTKVDAFRAIWEQLPKYRFLVKLSKWPVISQSMDLGYEIFALARPLLPKKQRDDCSTSPYCETHQSNNTK